MKPTVNKCLMGLAFYVQLRVLTNNKRPLAAIVSGPCVTLTKILPAEENLNASQHMSSTGKKKRLEF